MKFQAVFRRYEMKYILDRRQKEAILARMDPYMKIDQYGKTSVRNLYFDTDNYRLIRRSIEKPIYKEKLRVRCYGSIDENDNVFVELKKKCEKVVFKRRVILPEFQAMSWLSGQICHPCPSQISNEIDYFIRFYEGLAPRVFLSYDREAFYAVDGSDFRVTFDQNIRFRQDRLSLCEDVDGTPLLDEDRYLMEIKCVGGLPMWMATALSEEKLYKTSFSKYGIAYGQGIYPALKGEVIHV